MLMKSLVVDDTHTHARTHPAGLDNIDDDLHNSSWLSSPLHPRFQVMKTYHMYNTDSINAESKLKEAEKQEEKQMGRSGRLDDRQTPRSPDTLASIKSEEKPIRRSSVKKIEKMKEKVGPWAGGAPPVVSISREWFMRACLAYC